MSRAITIVFFLVLFSFGRIFADDEKNVSNANIPLTPEVKSLIIQGESEMLIADKEKPETFAAAIATFKQVVELAPSYSDGYRLLSRAEEGAQNYTEAIQNLKSYLQAHPSSLDSIAAREQLIKLQEMQNTTASHKGEELIKEREAAMNTLLGVWNESLSYKYRGDFWNNNLYYNAIGTGKFTFTKLGDTIFGHEEKLRIQFRYTQGYYEAPAPILRGTFENPQSAELTWVVFPLNENQHIQGLPKRKAKECRNLDTAGIPIGLTMEGSKIQFGYTYGDLDKCFDIYPLIKDYSLDWTLTK